MSQSEVRLAIVGSTVLDGNPLASVLLAAAASWFRPDVIISGGAAGVDRMAAQYARSHAIPLVEHLPKNPQWEPEGYKERNVKIAEDCTIMLRISGFSSKTFGSGWTAKEARRLGKSVVEIII